MNHTDGAPEVTGLDSARRVAVMENHDRAYALWRERGEKQRLLLHLDAHHDVWWMPKPGLVSIANFICPALKEDLVREVYWIVPDATWQTASGRRAVVRHLKAIVKGYPGPRRPIVTGADEISTAVLGKPLRVRPLAALPALEEPVLLDIDVDFLVIPRVTYNESDERRALPWCWPEQLVERLRALGIRSDFVTIAYSVEGGFTPLEWKYLGDELALRLEAPGRAATPGAPATDEAPLLLAMSLMRQGATLAAGRDFTRAGEACLEAARLAPESAAPSYHLARLYLEMDRIGEARECYQRALSIDPAYSTPYGNAGLKRYSERRFDDARREYQRALSLNPDDPCSRYGLARLAARDRNWSEVERLSKLAIAADPEFTDAYRVLGDSLSRQGKIEPAIAAYERSLRLALAGHKPLGEPIATFVDEGGRALDPAHGRIHARLARLYETKGAMAEAASGYRIGIAAGDDGFSTRGRLARVYARQRQWAKAAGALGSALKSIPKSIRRAYRRRCHHLKLRWRARWTRDASGADQRIAKSI